MSSMNLSLIHICAWEQHEKKPVLHLHATGQYGVQLFKDLEKEKNFAEGDGCLLYTSKRSSQRIGCSSAS